MVEVDTRPFEPDLQIQTVPDYETFVVDTHIKDTEIDITSNGTTWLDGWKMNDGTEYDVLYGEPRDLRTDVLVAFTTPLGTQVNGRSKFVADELMQLGFRVAVVGPEIGSSIPISHTAHNFQMVLNKLDNQGHHEPGLVIITGESRAAMAAFGIASYNTQHDRHGIFYDITDPCYATKPNFLNPREVAHMLTGLPAEIICTGKQLGRLAFSGADLIEYAKTVDLSLAGAKQIARTGRPLLSGEAGVLAAQMPKDTMMHIRFFLNSIANQRDEYRKILAELPGVVIEEPRGGHLSLMRRDTHNYRLRRMAALRDQLEAGVRPREIDFSYVHLGAAAVAA